MMDRRASDGVGIVDTAIVAGTDEAGNTMGPESATGRGGIRWKL